MGIEIFSFVSNLFKTDKSDPKSGEASFENQSLARLIKKGDKLGDNEIGCVFDGPVLREMSKREAASNGVCWAVPTNRVDLSILLPARDGHVVESVVGILFEPEMDLGKQLENKEKFDRDDLSQIVLNSFVEMIREQNIVPEDLPKFSSENLEKLRAKFSVALGVQGFRCDTLLPFRLVSSSFENKIPAAVESLKEQSENNTDKKEYSSKKEITVQKNDKARECFFRFLEAAENSSPDENDRLGDLAEFLIHSGMNSSECTRAIVEASNKYSKKAGIERPDLSYWNGLLDRVERVSAECEGPKVSPKDPSCPIPEKPNRPAFDMLKDPLAFESRLRIFLYKKVQAAESMVALLKNKAENVRQMVFLRELEEDLSHLKGLMEGMSKQSIAESRLFVDVSVLMEFYAEANKAIEAGEHIEFILMNGAKCALQNQNEITTALAKLTGYVNRLIKG